MAKVWGEAAADRSRAAPNDDPLLDTGLLQQAHERGAQLMRHASFGASAEHGEGPWPISTLPSFDAHAAAELGAKPRRRVHVRLVFVQTEDGFPNQCFYPRSMLRSHFSSKPNLLYPQIIDGVHSVNRRRTSPANS